MRTLNAMVFDGARNGRPAAVSGYYSCTLSHGPERDMTRTHEIE
jgi:hypothetical protein